MAQRDDRGPIATRRPDRGINGPFGGEVAAILWGSLSPYAVAVGLACATVLLALSMIFRSGPARGALPFILFAVNGVFLLRVALQSAFGPADAGLFRNQGSTWMECGAALVRFLLLDLVWGIPAALLARAAAGGVASALTAGPGFGLPGPALLIALAAVALLPPICLIASVAAVTFRDLFDRELWRATFGGRSADVVLLMAVHLGGTFGGAGFAYLSAVALGVGKLKLMVAMGAAAGVYSYGVLLLLLGRLVGGFVRSGAAPVEAALESPTPAPGFVARPAAASTSESPRRSPVVETVVRSGGTAAEHVAAARPSAASASLLEILRANERLSRSDPNGALKELLELLPARGRAPQLLARIAALQAQLQPAEAFATAQEAAQHACALGCHGAIADLLEPFQDRLEELGLSAEDWVKVAATQRSLRKLDVAIALYRRLLGTHPQCSPAIRGLVQIADELLKADGADQALAIFDYLDSQCPGHPYTEFTDRGREAAERKLLGSR